MTRRDPAVEAARNVRRRYLESIGITDTRPGYEGATNEEIAAAREALEPIREKFEQLRAAAASARRDPSDPAYDIGDAFDDGVLSLCDELAPLIYPADELKDNQ